MGRNLPFCMLSQAHIQACNPRWAKFSFSEARKASRNHRNVLSFPHPTSFLTYISIVLKILQGGYSPFRTGSWNRCRGMGDIEVHVPNAQLRLKILGKRPKGSWAKCGVIWGRGRRRWRKRSLTSSKEHVESSGALDNAALLVSSQIPYHLPRRRACIFRVGNDSKGPTSAWTSPAPN